MWVPQSAAAVAGYTGTYVPEWEKSWAITAYPEGNRLFYHSVIPGETGELFYERKDTYFVTPESNNAFVFTRNTTRENRWAEDVHTGRVV